MNTQNKQLRSAEDFIREAIQGGWTIFDGGPVNISDSGSWGMIGAQKNGVYKMWPVTEALVDPLAWQAFEKAHGWGKDTMWRKWQSAWLDAHNETIFGSKDAETNFWLTLP